MTCSMSRPGNVWDNAAMESYFSSLKTERTARRTYRTWTASAPRPWVVIAIVDSLSQASNVSCPRFTQASGTCIARVYPEPPSCLFFFRSSTGEGTAWACFGSTSYRTRGFPRYACR